MAVIAAMMVVLSAVFIVLPIGGGGPVYEINAKVLSGKPDNYFVLDDPDSYVSKAVSNPGEYVTAKPQDTQIYNLMAQHGTNSLLVNGSYYQINVLIGDTFGNSAQYLAAWEGVLAASTVVLIATLAYRFERRLRQEEKKKVDAQ